MKGLFRQKKTSLGFKWVFGKTKGMFFASFPFKRSCWIMELGWNLSSWIMDGKKFGSPNLIVREGTSILFFFIFP